MKIRSICSRRRRASRERWSRSILGTLRFHRLEIGYPHGALRYQDAPADLARANVSVIAAVGGVLAARAAMAATIMIPIVFTTPGDPVRQGLVASLNRPGGPVTGLTTTNASLIAKQMEFNYTAP